ncbi:MAG: glycine zipper family protein [Treponemataceae bacterium]
MPNEPMENNLKEIKPLLVDFIKTFIKNREEPLENWLPQKMQESLPQKNQKEIESIISEIVSFIKLNEEKKISLQKAIESGRSKESWLASELKKQTQELTDEQSAEYYSNIYNAFDGQNKEYKKILDIEPEKSEDLDTKNWNEYKAKEFSTKIAEKVSENSSFGTLFTSEAFDFVQKNMTDTDFSAADIYEDLLDAKNDYNLKTTIASAINVGYEKDFFPSIIQKDFAEPASAAIACVAVECTRVFKKFGNGTLTVEEACEGVAQTSACVASTTVEHAGMTVGAKIGGMIGAAFGVLGSSVGGFVGAIAGKALGTEAGKAITKGIHTVKEKVVEGVKWVGEKVKQGWNTFTTGIQEFFSF